MAEDQLQHELLPASVQLVNAQLPLHSFAAVDRVAVDAVVLKDVVLAVGKDVEANSEVDATLVVAAVLLALYSIVFVVNTVVGHAAASLEVAVAVFGMAA